MRILSKFFPIFVSNLKVCTNTDPKVVKMTRKVITTKDGSSSIFWEELNGYYHSIHGAWQESLHVFIQEGINWYCQKYPEKKRIKLMEVGLGTGLNAILTLEYALQNPDFEVEYHSIEPFPLTQEEIQTLNYKSLLNNNLSRFFDEIHTANWGNPIRFADNFIFQKYQSTLMDFSAENQFDIIYYDAFAPTKQEEMWNLAHLGKANELLIYEGIWVTYCAKGYVKRNLKELGMTVTSPQGAAGKREMIRAIKN